ncbi:hypothetical protein OIA45_48850 (plasmid) [Streptomyces chartreusis]|uniref:hypothetical protein n=1 Tax=Streptomyces chartreusis TaxID=1969 RepID=UPI0037DC8622|nr:hypothetical protein OIA45_48850 [Streptomyces chartreusis]
MNDRKGIALGLATVVTVATALTAITTDTAHGATGPTTSGPGWKLRSSVTHIDTAPWQITFHDATSRTKLTAYLKNNAAELSSYLGVKVTVTTRIVPTSTSKCLPSHTISYRWQSKPDPVNPNRSYAVPCSWNKTPYSASVYINSDYWSPTRRFHEYQRMNVIWHESAHAVGLTHPATCPKDKVGRLPIMCNAESYKALSTRRYSSFEVTAFKYLRTNRAYYPVP